jgi:DNA polymerase III delta subunit
MTMLKLRAVLGTSARLRDESLAPLVAEWKGPLKRATDPADLRSILSDVDTPSLFGDPTLWLVRGSEAWLKGKAAELAPLAGCEAVAGALVLVAPGIDGRLPLAKALAAAHAVIDADPPWSGLKPWEAGPAAKAWVAERLAAHAAGVQRAMLCAEQLHAHAGEDADALLAAVDVLRAYADEAPITPEAVEAVVVGTASRPVYEFSGAVLAGEAAKALGLLHAGQGMEPGQAMAVLHNEVRKQIACLDAPDDAGAAELAGIKGRPNLRLARRQAQTVGRPALVRLLGGVLKTQRQLRGGAEDPLLAVELLVLHARQLLAPGKR